MYVDDLTVSLDGLSVCVCRCSDCVSVDGLSVCVCRLSDCVCRLSDCVCLWSVCVSVCRQLTDCVSVGDLTECL